MCMPACKCACLCTPMCVFSRGQGLKMWAFKLTEHASASTRSNYHAIKRIRGNALEVRVGINACLKDDLCSARINSPTLEKSIALCAIGIHLCHLLGTRK